MTIKSPKKSPQTEMTSAAGKYLRKMDLPLARSEPSPPYLWRQACCLARGGPIALLDSLPKGPLLAQATRARLEFVGGTHRKRIHSSGVSLLTTGTSAKLPSGSNCIAVLAAASAVISRACHKVKQRMALRAFFLILFSQRL